MLALQGRWDEVLIGAVVRLGANRDLFLHDRYRLR